MKRQTLSILERLALVEQKEVPVTLDGEPAVVFGYKLDFARVQRKDGRGGVVEFAWPTVKHVLEHGGNFKS